MANQIGNPDKVTAILLKLINEPNPPMNLFLGSGVMFTIELFQKLKIW